METDQQLLDMLGIRPQSKSQAEINALRNQQNLGMLLGGSSVGNVGSLGQAMYKQASNELAPDNNDFNNLMKVMQFQAMQDSRAGQAEDRALRRSTAAQQAADKQERRAFTEAQKLEKVWDDRGYDQMVDQINQINVALDPYRDQLAEGDYDLPGFGKIEGHLPVFGADAESLRSQVGTLQQMVLKSFSGSSASDQEMRRTAENLGTIADEKVLLQNILFLTDALNRRMQQTANVYSPSARETFFGPEGLPQAQFTYSNQPMSTQDLKSAVQAEINRRKQQQ